MIIGMKLYYVPRDSRFRSAKEVMVKKIGRKWVHLENGDRFERGCGRMVIDGGHYSSPGRCYVDKEAYEKETRVNKLYSDIRATMAYQAPEGITESDLLRAALLLKMDLK